MAVRFGLPAPGFAAAGRVPAFRRLRWALGVSVLLHMGIAAVLLGDARQPGAGARAVPALTVVLPARSDPRNDPAPREVPDSEVTGTVGPSAGTHASAPSFRSVLPDPSPGRASRMPASDVATPVVVARPPPVADPAYYSARELDVFPVPREALRFEYPQRAASEKVSGTVLVTMLIDEAGTVESVVLERAEPAGYFEDAVRGVLGTMTFSPGWRDGRAVKSRVLLRVEFDSGAMTGTAR
jgi:TonB family protein